MQLLRSRAPHSLTGETYGLCEKATGGHGQAIHAVRPSRQASSGEFDGRAEYGLLISYRVYRLHAGKHDPARNWAD